MATPVISTSGLNYLNQLKNNNNREWFAANKDTYQKELANVEQFAEALLKELSIHDVIETPSGKKSMHRIYRDTRFSKDNTPYKTCWSGSFRRLGKHRRGGYYFHIEPGNTFIAGGFFGPSPDDLKRIRGDIAFDAAPLRAILTSGPFINTFKNLNGEQLKTAPKGFPSDHEAIDLLKYKQFLLIRRFDDDVVLGDGFLHLASQTFKNMRPFFDHMSVVLTTDINGEDL